MVSLIVAAIVALGAAICIAVKTPGDTFDKFTEGFVAWIIGCMAVLLVVLCLSSVVPKEIVEIIDYDVYVRDGVVYADVDGELKKIDERVYVACDGGLKRSVYRVEKYDNSIWIRSDREYLVIATTSEKVVD